MDKKSSRWVLALFGTAVLSGLAIAEEIEVSKPSIGVVSASGCYFISPDPENKTQKLRLDNICDAEMDQAWEAHLNELLVEQGIYEPRTMTFDRDEVRSVLHDEPSTDPKLPPQFDLKESASFLKELAAENDVDYLLILRADGNRLNNGFWMNHSGIMQRPFGRAPVLYYSAEMILFDVGKGKKIKSGPVKGPYTGDLASFPHQKLDKAFKGRGMGVFSDEQRIAMLAQLDDLAKAVLERTLPKIVRKKKQRRRR